MLELFNKHKTTQTTTSFLGNRLDKESRELLGKFVNADNGNFNYSANGERYEKLFIHDAFTSVFDEENWEGEIDEDLITIEECRKVKSILETAREVGIDVIVFEY